MPKGTPPANQPKTLAERAALADKCMRELKLTIPILLDDMEGTAENGYSGWPDRIVVIGADGRIAYPGRPGPFGFKPAEAEAVLKGLVK